MPPLSAIFSPSVCSPLICTHTKKYINKKIIMMIMIMKITILLLLLLLLIIINKYIHTEIRRRSTRCLTAKYNPFPTVETKIFSMKDWTVPKYNRSRRLANMRCTRGTTRGHALQIRKTTTFKSILARFRYVPLWKIVISEKTN